MLRNSRNNKDHHETTIIIIIISIILVNLNATLLLNAQEIPSTTSSANHGSELALNLRDHLTRLKRQSSQSSSANVNGPPLTGANGGGGGGGVSSSSSSSSPDGSGASQLDSDEKPPEEILSNLKCDFGSSDALDLCKFKILDHEQNNNPLGKSLASWTLGTGRSALFQGGPLIDASLGNDTNGGYIFYETSNPFVVANQHQQQQQHQQPTQHHQHQNATATSHLSDYATTLFTPSHLKHQQRNNNHHHEQMNSAPQMDQPNYSYADGGLRHISSGRLSVSSNLPGPSFVTPNLTAPGPSGMCLSFQYAIQGLSADELRVYVTDQKTERMRQIWASSESAASNWTKGEVLYSVNNKHSLMFTATTGGLGGAGQAGSSSTSAAALKDLQQRQRFRGYLALDEIEIQKHDPLGGESCKGHCNFDGDLCGWTNAENGQEDDFDWTFGRGSDNLFTGPARDYTSSSNNELTGSYLFTQSGYPRRPGDRALLVSPVFQATAVNEAMCMRLAVHMFGNGIGSLAIKIRYTDEEPASPSRPSAGANSGGDTGAQQAAAGGASSSLPGTTGTGQAGAGGAQGAPFSASSRSSSSSSSSPSLGSSSDGSKPNDLVIWEMSGDAGNSWHQAQTSVSSAKGPFQVLIEGVVGENHLGNIAIDEISLSSGPCPTSPPLASKNYGDCTFEQSMCYWRNPDADIHLDDLDWIRSADEQSIHGPSFDHTLKKRSGSYLKLENTFREPKSGTRAFLLSPIFQPKASGSVQCLSFYYYMFMRSISSSGPNLGTIRVYLASNNELVPIWRLTNPISSPSWKHARASLATSMLDGQPVAPTKLFQIAFEGIWGDAAGGAIALDDITVFDGACDIMPAEAKSVPGECTFDVDLCSWSNKTYELAATSADSTDSSRSPFLQSVNSAPGGGRLMMGSMSRTRLGWQLATVDSRPVNLQDHTYKAPIGYAYIDVLDSGGQQAAAFPLQSAEVTVQSGQQVANCLSFWFAAYGRQDNNQLSVYITQASAPPPPPSDESGATSAVKPQASGATGGGGGGPTTPSGGASSPVEPAESENANAWKMIDGKLIWSVSLKNITETSRRKWLYGQATLKADSNHIVRFVATSNDGGFALDDISYFDGACETRPAHAKVVNPDEDESSNQPAAGAPGKLPATT